MPRKFLHFLGKVKFCNCNLQIAICFQTKLYGDNKVSFNLVWTGNYFGLGEFATYDVFYFEQKIGGKLKYNVCGFIGLIFVIVWENGYLIIKA